jgi:hypothetical protein
MNENLIKSRIKGLEVICYVVTEDQLDNQQRESILGDMFLLIASIMFGSAVSNAFPNFTIFSILLGALMLFLSIWQKYLKYALKKKLEKSSEVKYINYKEDNDSIEIIKATYGSTTRNVDVTETVRGKLVNNKIDMLVLNEEIGFDPHERVNKTLEIIYKHADKIITKKCDEYKRLTIP